MTGQEIMAVVGFMVMLVTAGAKLYMSLAKRTDDARKEASEVMARVGEVNERLSRYKLHVAETYVSKEDMQNSLKPVMESINSVKGAVDNLASRIDRVIEARPSSRARNT
ncbi:putative tape measure protein [Rhizobium phage RHph_X2_26]|nr:putative tape measure protein [Rhizobium phage RHph_X2_26]